VWLKGHRKSVFQDARDLSLEPAQVIDVGDHPFARLPGDRRDQGHATRRYIDDLAGKLTSMTWQGNSRRSANM
jgi:hypothetical protein